LIHSKDKDNIYRNQFRANFESIKLMDDKGNAGDNTGFALKGASVLAKLVGIVYPPASPLAYIIDTIQKRRTDKHIKQLEKFVQSLERRLSRFEGNVPETTDIDLFDEIVAKAVSDEDEDKTELYAALVQYWMDHNSLLAPYEVRLLGNAIRELTVDEIEAFHGFFISKQVYPTKKMPKSLQEVIWNRVAFLGLLGGIGRFDMINPSNVTQIGQKLVEIYKLSITTL
jgi:hypothetical protein